MLAIKIITSALSGWLVGENYAVANELARPQAFLFDVAA